MAPSKKSLINFQSKPAIPTSRLFSSVPPAIANLRLHDRRPVLPSISFRQEPPYHAVQTPETTQVSIGWDCRGTLFLFLFLPPLVSHPLRLFNVRDRLFARGPGA